MAENDLNIQDPQEPVEYQNALMSYFSVRANNPDQEMGNGGAIPNDIDGISYLVVRNQDSYTVRVRGSIEEEEEEGVLPLPPPDGFPV